MGYIGRIDCMVQKPWNSPWLDYIFSHIREKKKLQDGLGTHSLGGCIQDPFENIMFMSLGVEECPSLSF